MRHSIFQVEGISGCQEIEAAVIDHQSIVIVDGDVTFADHLETVPANENAGILVKSDAQKFGSRFDNFNQIEVAISFEQMLIDGRVAKKAKTFFVVTHHDGIG